MFGIIKTALSLFMGGNALVRIALYIAAGVTIAGGVWFHGYMQGQASADSKQLRTKIARLEAALEKAQDLLSTHDTETAKDDALDQRNKELIDATPENNRLCFDADHIERLRQLR